MAYTQRAELAFGGHLWQHGQQGAPSAIKDTNNSFAYTPTSVVLHVTEH